MERIGRRGFVIGSAAGLAGLSVAARGFAGPLDPDLIVYNARIYTVDDATPRATAFAVRGGRFVAVGSDDVKSLASRATRVVDAKGLTITPGFIDCHNHASGEVLLNEVLVGNPFEVEFVTIDSIVDKLRAKAARTAPDTWVEGFFFDDTKLKDGRVLDVRDLDRVSTTQPVAVHHRGGHTAFYNSKALQMAGVTRDTPNPAGGVFDRFPDGALNGRVSDNALGVFDKVGARAVVGPAERERRSRDAAAFMSRKFVEYGLTGVCHEGEQGDLAALEAIRGDGRLLHRASYEPTGVELEAMIAAGIRTGFGDDTLRIGATYEHIADGSFSERTMALSAPYPGTTSGYRGNVTEAQSDLDAWVEHVHRAGFQANCHANGDVGIDHVLTAYERAQAAFPVTDARWKITHCSLAPPPLIARIKALGASPALFSTYAYYNGDKFHFYGEALMEHMMPYRDLLDAGVRACAGSDFDPGPFSPMMALQSMVTRTGWNGQTWGANQKISVDEALRVHTLNGAWDTREEHLKGSIAPGKLADFVVLSDDPHTVAPDRIKDIQIIRTVVGGETRFER